MPTTPAPAAATRAGVFCSRLGANLPLVDAAEAEAVVAAISNRTPTQAGTPQLLAFGKACSGLTDAEFKAVDQAIRAHTLEKFGPVRSVRPTLLFELGFEGIACSPRHKSGIALRFPRMSRIRHDKPQHQADSRITLEALITRAQHAPYRQHQRTVTALRSQPEKNAGFANTLIPSLTALPALLALKSTPRREVLHQSAGVGMAT